MPSPEYQLLKQFGVPDLHNAELIKACKHDRTLLGEFLIANRDFIFSILIHFKGNIEELCKKFNITEEELFQHACIGIITALHNFDFDKGIKFSTYVYRPILWEVNQFLYNDSKQVKLSRGAIDLIKRMIELEDGLGYRPSEEEMANLLHITLDRYREIAVFSDEIEHYDAIEDFDIADRSERNLEESVTTRLYVQSLLEDEMFTDFEVEVMRLIVKFPDNNHSQIAERLGVYPMTINRTLARIRSKIEAREGESGTVEKEIPSKYSVEIGIIAQEKRERREILGIEDIADLLDVCGYDKTSYTRRNLYYIRQKAMQKVDM
ncbi:sigma-70 family RNA polymerase sigma factor [Paenibacillus massiliensis]|uniref:sigma-70 family RNA polymerase sigma factor n=1 Tax=Paenibacillus massiliensis TaxID=225917 RepID=UPI000374DAEF|nr:sigma factor [Paenibacillus massiliensis]